ncbi:11367_t:CDS:1 [Paraglomus brasilianum]|uniref:11367_t:CDS:1 n=1 Tax=Paraglomus brasilianum TaxID=144538 RepID=A0A9N9BL87_9GLOM|nr:11367_t:CDS:1 [Paraglomus brasilianum]
MSDTNIDNDAIHPVCATLATIIREIFNSGHASLTIILQPKLQIHVENVQFDLSISNNGDYEMSLTKDVPKDNDDKELSVVPIYLQRNPSKRVATSSVRKFNVSKFYRNRRYSYVEPDLSFLTDEQRQELYNLLEDVAAGQSNKPKYHVPNNIDATKLKGWIRNNSLSLHNNNKTSSQRFWAAYRLGMIFFFLKSKQKLVNSTEQAEVLGYEMNRLFMEKKQVFRICEVFMILGGKALQKVKAFHVADFLMWSEWQYQALLDYIRAIKNGWIKLR